jgi:hypothetical protein
LVNGEQDLGRAGSRADELAARRQQAEALSRLMFLSGVALTHALIEPLPVDA